MDVSLVCRQVDSIEFYSMEAERLKALAEVERTVAVRQNIGVAFITFDDASVASRYVYRMPIHPSVYTSLFAGTV